MPAPFIIAALVLTAARSVRHWVVHLGGIGLIPLGLLDSSLIPLPGSMDVVTILLAARDQDLWPYYALMATVGSVVGGFVTYRLARRGGKEALARRFSGIRMTKLCSVFERWGFASVAIPALLPPPVPMTPFLLAAGAMQYSLKKFLAALALGRVVRYSILAFLAAHYGRQILGLMRRNAIPIAVAAVLVSAAALAIALFMRRGSRQTSAAD